MDAKSIPYAQRDQNGAYVVGLPRSTDAMGSALRSAFGCQAHLPADLRTCLATLDRHPDIA